MNKFLLFCFIFFVCIIGSAIAQPANDNPCNATPLSVGATCAFTSYNNNNATATIGVPSPGCANYSGGDVWFSVTVPASGNITVDSKQGTLTDGGMAFYTGPNCNSLTLLSCDDDNSNNGLMPLLNASPLVPGTTLWIRFWAYGNVGNGTFKLCATSGPDATNQDCPNAIPICQNTYSTIVSYTGTGSIPGEINSGNSCLASGERNDVWYTFTVNTSGTLNFLITPVNMNDDYDWAVYNLTNANCSDIATNAGIMVSCNYSSTDGTTGPNGGSIKTSQNAGGTPYNAVINVTAGQTYVVNVSNYSSSNDGYSIDFGASTANIFDAVPPALVSLNQPLACGATSITFDFSENIQCSSVQNGDFTLTGPGGPYIISNWTSTGCAIGADYDNTYTITVSPPITTTGNYSFCLTNASGSVMDLCGNVAAPSCQAFAVNAMTGNVNFTNISCNSGTNGTITITANGGTAPIVYSIDNGVTFQAGNVFNGLPAGTYNVEARDASGCNYITVVNIVEPNPIVVNPVVVDAGCGQSNGSITMNVVGGTGALQYSDNNGVSFQASNVFNNLSAGNYNLVVKDANGCTGTITVAINNASSPVINAVPSIDENCNSGTNGSITINASGGTGALQFSINNGVSFQAGNTFNNLPAGYYNIVIQDGNGCQASTTVTINQPSPIVINPNSNNSTCGNSNGNININANGGTGALQYSINNGATFQGGNSFNNLAAGNYNIVVQDANGCQTAGNINVADTPGPNITSVPATDANCNGAFDGSITINSNGGTPSIQFSIDNGTTFQAGNAFNAVAAGNYTVVIIDANGCQDVANVNIAEPPALVLNPNLISATCGMSNGSISINANGGTGAIQYSIDNGATWQGGNTFNNLPTGNYDLAIRDANGCIATATINIADAPPPAIAATPTVDASCNGGSDGSVTVTTNGGTGAIQYSIDNGATWQGGDTFNGLGAGNYTVTIEDINGCQATANVVINEPILIVFNTNAIDGSCGNSNGSITINGNGGTGALQYSIDGGITFQNGNTFSGLAAGNYNIVVQDANGCQASNAVVVNDQPSPTISATPSTDVSCNGGTDGTIAVNSNGGTGAIQYSIDNGTTFQAGNIFNNLPAGNYQIVIQDANGCQAAANVNIAEPTPLVLNINATTSTCGNNNGSIDITANGGTGGIQYSIDNGTSFQAGNTFNNLPSGNYNIVIQDANGCIANGNINVPDAPSPMVGATPTVDATCNNGFDGSVTINANGGTGAIQYSIDNGTTWQNGNSFSGLAAGNYTITIQDANGCIDTKNINIGEPAAININSNTVTATCGNSDGSIIINANGGTGTYQYSINNGATFQNGNTFNNLPPGNYDIIVQDANGCQGVDVTSVSNASAPSIPSTPVTDANCNGDSNGTITVNANGGTGALQYSIDNGATWQAGNNFNGLPAGTYSIVVEDVNGCQANTSATINEPTPVVYNANPTTATCENSNGSIVIIANGGTGALQYSIDNGTTFQASATFNNLASGNYDIVVQDANGCSVSGTEFVNNAASPAIALVNTDDLTCNGSNDGTITITSNGGTGAIQYSIDNGTTFQPGGAFNNLPAGNYSILIQDANGCTDVSNVNLAQPPAIVFNAATVQSTCGNSNGSINLNANGGNGSFQFSIDSGLTYQAGNIFNGLPAGNYNVIIRDGSGCSASGIVSVTNASSPAINAVNVVDASCYGLTNGSITINANGGIGGLEYSIDNGTTFQNGSNFTNLPAGTYNIVVQDGNGCSVVDVANIVQPTEITFSTATVNSLCGNATGILTITAQGGTGALQYSKNNGTTFQASNTFNNLGANNYDIIVKDATGCQVVGIASVSNINGPIISGTVVNDLTCFGSNNGSILVNANGGTGNLTYSIDNGTTYQAGNSFINLPGGAYSIVVLDGNNCIASANATVNEPAQVVFNAIVTNETCTNSNGSINVIANGGTGALQYSNNSGTNFQNGHFFNNLPAGSYTIVVQDANGCTASAASVINDEAAPVIVSTNSTDVTCNGNTDGNIIVTANGGTGTIEYSIDNGTILFPNNTFNNLAAGIYHILIQDANGCTATIVDTIVEPAAIVFNSNTTTATCSNNNGSIVVNANGGLGTLEYSIDNGTTFQSTNTFNGVGTGTYNLVVQDANGCSSSGTAFVNNAASPVIASTPVVNVSCNGGSNGKLTVIANGGTGALQYSIDNGTTFQNSNIFNGLPAGNYQVVIHDANNCTTTAIASIIQPASISANTNSTTASCGNSDGTLTINANGGTGAYQYSINGGSSFQTSDIFNNLLAGNYSIIIKDANGCTKTIAGSISNTLAPVIVSSPAINVSCNGGSNGQITINSSGGTGVLQYSINNGTTFQSGNSFTGLPAGVYGIIVKDALGCLASTSKNVTEPLAITFTSSATIATCGNNNAFISISANGGTGNLSYSIDSGATFHSSASFNLIAPGTYYIFVHDANNCKASGNLNVTAAPTPVINSANAVDITCNGYNNGSITINASGGIGTINYSIDNGATYQTSNAFTNLSPGNYNIIVQDTNGCKDAAAAIIVQPAVISLSTATSNVNCFSGNDGSATVSVTGGTSPYTYSWTSGGTDSTATGLSSGSYTVIITDINNCTSSVSVTIHQPAALALASAFTDVACNGGNNGTASVTATGGTLPYSYLWSNSATVHNVSGLSAGNYSVIVTDAHSCTTLQSFTIFQAAALTSTISANPVSCFGFYNGSITVNPVGGTTPYSYQWSPTGGTNATANNLIAGTYSVIITDDHGCTLTKTDSVTSPSSLSANNNVSNVTCHGYSNGALTVTAAGGTVPYSYLWSMGATTSSIGNLPGGTYTVTVTDNNNCITYKASVVAEPQQLVLNVSSPATICIGQSSTISVTATGGTTPYNFAWSNGTTTNSQSVSPVVTTTYLVNITDANGCTASQQAVTITVNPALSVIASDNDAICEGESTTISAVASGGNGGPYTYLWSNNATASSSTVSPLQTTTYTVTVSDNCGTPVASDLVTIVVNPLPDVAFMPAPASGCIPLEVAFANNSITANGSDYQWTFGDGQNSPDINPVHTYYEPGLYDIKLTVTTPQGCGRSLMMPDAVNAFPLPVAAFTTDPPKASILHPEINFIDNSTGADYWSWDFGDDYGTATSENARYNYRDTGTYRITLFVENTYTCKDTAYGEVIIDGDFTIYIPNAFSPNGDGKNDVFTVYGIGIQEMSMVVFNRWGDKVFQTNSMNNSWNGSSQLKNEPCKEDVYAYIVKLIDLNGKKREFSGSVTLVR